MKKYLPLFANVLSQLLFGFAYLFSVHFSSGLMGVWVAMTIDWAFRALCYLVRYRGHKWERNF